MKQNLPLNLQTPPGFKTRGWLKHGDKGADYTKDMNVQEVERQLDLLRDHKATLTTNLERCKDKLALAQERYQQNNPNCEIEESRSAAHLREQGHLQQNTHSQEQIEQTIQSGNIGIDAKHGLTANAQTAHDTINRDSTAKQESQNNETTLSNSLYFNVKENENCKFSPNTTVEFQNVNQARYNYDQAQAKFDSLQQRQEHYQEYINHLNNPDNGDGTLRFRTDKTHVTIHLVDKTGVPATPGELPNDNLILMYESKEDGWFKKSNYRLDADGVLDRDMPSLNEVLGVQHPIAENKTSANDQEALHAQHVTPEVDSSEIHQAENATNNFSTEETADEIFKRIIADSNRGVRGPGNDGPDFC